MVDDEAAARWGIQHHYTDASGQERTAPGAVVEQVIDQLSRGEDRNGPTRFEGIEFTPAGTTTLVSRLRGRRLVTEHGEDLGRVDELPPDLPIGYHHLRHDDSGEDIELVVHPPHCHRPDDLRAWGWALQLHSDRSADSWGIGDLADARTVGEWSQSQGGNAMLMLSPVHAPNLGDDPQASPYFASSRCFRNPLTLRIAEVPGAVELGPELDAIAAAAKALNQQRMIDRPMVWALKRLALERIWERSARSSVRPTVMNDPTGPVGAMDFARFTVAVEHHGEDWASWPVGLRRPDGSGWVDFSRDHSDRIAFHAWIQELVDDQLVSLDQSVPILHDLAVGTDRNGFDAWYWQDLFVLDGTRIGAPADQFNTQGQDWGLPPMDPWRLRVARYQPFVQMLRCALYAGSGLRLDHVMGLFRLFWIPPEASPADGVYMRQPAEELLALVALESVRAAGIVVGEDLGTVEPGVREELAARRLLSYRVMSLDDTAPADYPRGSLASISTHDLPTVAGLWTGSDLADQQRLHLDPPVQDLIDARASFAHRIGVKPEAPSDEAVMAAHQTLGRCNSAIVLGQLEDAALVVERPNMPGTIDQWPNWSQALPRPIEDILDTPLATRIAGAMSRPGGEAER